MAALCDSALLSAQARKWTAFSMVTRGFGDPTAAPGLSTHLVLQLKTSVEDDKPWPEAGRSLKRPSFKKGIIHVPSMPIASD